MEKTEQTWSQSMKVNVFSLQQSFRVDFSSSLLLSQQLSVGFWIALNIREHQKRSSFFFLLVLYHDFLLSSLLSPLNLCSCNPPLIAKYLPPSPSRLPGYYPMSVIQKDWVTSPTNSWSWLLTAFIIQPLFYHKCQHTSFISTM